MILEFDMDNQGALMESATRRTYGSEVGWLWLVLPKVPCSFFHRCVSPASKRNIAKPFLFPSISFQNPHLSDIGIVIECLCHLFAFERRDVVKVGFFADDPSHNAGVRTTLSDV